MTTTERNQIERLMELAFKKFQPEDLATIFLENITFQKQRDKLVKVILADEYLSDDIKGELESYFLDGRMVIEVKEMTKIERIKDFLAKEIFPFYNEQKDINCFSF